MGSPPGLAAKPSVVSYTDSVRQPRIQLRIIESVGLPSAEILPRSQPYGRTDRMSVRPADRAVASPHRRLCNGSGAPASGSTISWKAKQVQQFRQFLLARDGGFCTAARGLGYDGHGVAAKVTVNLSQKAYEALEDAADITKDTKTDVINKALQPYNEVRAVQEADGGIWIQANKGSEAVKLRLY
jgi:hypothetical protein